MKLCKHEPHKVIDDILAPKWSNKTIRINVEKVSPHIEHYIIQFVEDSPKKLYGWFYMSGKVIRRHKVLPNGAGKVYEVPLDKREEFEPDNNCIHVTK